MSQPPIKALVTGGGGFLGGAMIRKLIEDPTHCLDVFLVSVNQSALTIILKTVGSPSSGSLTLLCGIPSGK